MNITELEISKLKPYEKNPRRNEDAVDYVAESIKQFGFKVPIVIDKDNVIIAGHTRFLASQKLGLEKVPCIKADDLNEEQVKAFRLADNKVSEFSAWDFDLLNEELDGIVDIDMSVLGFEDIEPIDIDNFFEESTKETKEKEPEKIQCPHCGEWFEV